MIAEGNFHNPLRRKGQAVLKNKDEKAGGSNNRKIKVTHPSGHLGKVHGAWRRDELLAVVSGRHCEGGLSAGA